MAKFELMFLDCFYEKDFIKCKLSNHTKEVSIIPKECIYISGINNGVKFGIILDKSTAIKFAKTLRTEINKITESEVNNG